MGAVMVAGGMMGTGIGAVIFRLLQKIGQIDTVIDLLYVRAAGLDRAVDGARERPRARHGAARHAVRRRASGGTIRWSRPCRCAGASIRSGLYISPLAPLLLGMVTGILTMLMGIGGGFVLVPAMLYILGMSAQRGRRHVAVPDPVRDDGDDDGARADDPCGRYRAGLAAADRQRHRRADRRAARA